MREAARAAFISWLSEPSHVSPICDFSTTSSSARLSHHLLSLIQFTLILYAILFLIVSSTAKISFHSLPRFFSHTLQRIQPGARQFQRKRAGRKGAIPSINQRYGSVKTRVPELATLCDNFSA